MIEVPIPMAVVLVTSALAYAGWNFRCLDHIAKQQIMNSARLFNIEQKLNLENPFQKEQI